LESLESRVERLEYYQKILFELIDNEKVHLYKLIVEANLTKADVEDLFTLCEAMNSEYETQKAEGLVVFTPLLTQFVGSLHPNLDVEKTIEVFLKQGSFVAMMKEFKDTIKILKE
jgi:hypothetical protein